MPGGNQQASARARGEVECGSVSLWKVVVGVNPSTAEFNKRRHAPDVQVRVPAENDGIESSTGDPLRRELDKNRHKVRGIFQLAAAPTDADFSGDGVADGNSRSEELRFRK